jgi:hypothetical protein
MPFGFTEDIMPTEKADVFQGPPTDPATALRDACAMIKQLLANQEAERVTHAAAMEELGKTIDLSAHDLAVLKAEWEAEHQAAAPRRDLVDAFASGLGQFFAEWNSRKEARKKKRVV